jgi:hypothetical protein
MKTKYIVVGVIAVAALAVLAMGLYLGHVW